LIYIYILDIIIVHGPGNLFSKKQCKGMKEGLPF
jgi:hypothetical protein